MAKPKPIQKPIPLKVDWREAERAAWAPLEGRELSADMAIRRLRQLEGDVEGFYLQLQVIRRLLETPEDCDCGRIMPAMPRGGGNGKKA